MGQLSAGGGQGTGERGPPGTPRLASRIPRLEPRAPRPVPRVLPACRASCISRAPRRPWSWKVGCHNLVASPARAWVRGPRAQLKSSRARQAAASRLGVWRPALLPPAPPLLALLLSPKPLSAPIRSDRALSSSFFRTPSLPTPLFPRLSSSPPLPPALPPRGGGASPLPPRQCCGCASPPSPPASRGLGCQRLFRAENGGWG